ncbi:MAG TPA: hypothetical protein VE569_09975 [Acidimicrobiia bacterium]|nr:hypothetical protein [Acidimicrobiia bacterium]
MIPAPLAPVEVHRQARVRNARAWRCFFAVDGEGAIVLRGWLAADLVTLDELDRVLGEYAVEVAFRPMIRAGLGTTSRKKGLETCKHAPVDKPCGKPRFLLETSQQW